ncbi:MAG: anhydro-N-acetylmuramic acid kinase, partial [Pseudomonadota bacterium]
ARLAWDDLGLNRATDKFEPIWVAGFMSGTSLDAVDAALLLTDGEQVLEFGPVVERKYTPSERTTLQQATDAARAWSWSGPEPELGFAEARKVITQTHLDAFERLCEVFDRREISLAGVHGQTVLHRRPTPDRNGATRQLIDAPDLARALGVRIAYDFRTDDVLAGGEGAPLAPIYHSVLMAGLDEGPIAVLNLGGVANITARLSDGTLVAFDTGPANGPIDEWVERHGRATFDLEGQLAAAGHVDETKLAELLGHEWFSKRPPKSLDRYDFNASMVEHLSLEDGAATLTAFSARAVAAGIAQLPERPTRVVACGGGRHNPTLIRMLRDALPCQVMLAEEAGWRGDSIEAEAFAVLAARTLRGLPISFPLTTGVAEPMTGGKLQDP